MTQPAPKPDQVNLPYSYAKRITEMAGREEKVSVPLQVLRIALASGEGFIKVTGEVGTGKTLLLRKLMAGMQALTRRLERVEKAVA